MRRASSEKSRPREANLKIDVFDGESKTEGGYGSGRPWIC